MLEESYPILVATRTPRRRGFSILEKQDPITNIYRRKDINVGSNSSSFNKKEYLRIDKTIKDVPTRI